MSNVADILVRAHEKAKGWLDENLEGDDLPALADDLGQAMATFAVAETAKAIYPVMDELLAAIDKSDDPDHRALGKTFRAIYETIKPRSTG